MQEMHLAGRMGMQESAGLGCFSQRVQEACVLGAQLNCADLANSWWRQCWQVGSPAHAVWVCACHVHGVLAWLASSPWASRADSASSAAQLHSCSHGLVVDGIGKQLLQVVPLDITRARLQEPVEAQAQAQALSHTSTVLMHRNSRALSHTSTVLQGASRKLCHCQGPPEGAHQDSMTDIASSALPCSSCPRSRCFMKLASCPGGLCRCARLNSGILMQK